LCCTKIKIVSMIHTLHTPPTLCWLSPIRPLYCVCVCVCVCVCTRHSAMCRHNNITHAQKRRRTSHVLGSIQQTSPLTACVCNKTPLNFHSIKNLKKINKNYVSWSNVFRAELMTTGLCNFRENLSSTPIGYPVGKMRGDKLVRVTVSLSCD